ncbi:MAG: hypothetical protein JST17_01910 [Bacteroidetes bacterium]|nr:hypothetical protein [Bacteroidota bacterium]MBS1931418.1 hypothetical protein [Bacteroidota bacterium]
MKQFFLLVFLSLYGICLYAQNDKQSKPYSTPFGTPFGKIISAKIDSRGGELRSEDSGLEIIIPGAALDTSTTISIQSIHNELNENDEGAYQLEPTGINFKKPLQLIFHFKDSNVDIKRIGWQDSKGIWHSVNGAVIDTVQKTICCFVSHFSRWSRFDKIYLSPNKARVKVNKTVSFTIISLEDIRDRLGDELSASSDDNSSDDNALLAAPHPYHYFSREWTVNGIVNGDNTVGTATKQDNRHAVYKAPGTTPQNNPVAVSVQILSDKNQKLLLTSNVTVIGDQYHFTYIHIDENGCFFLVDSSSCIINMQKDKVSISNIINYKPWSDWPQCDKPCKTTWTNKESLKGLVEITGITGSSVTPASEGVLPNVNIVFAPAMGNTPSESVTCKDHSFNVPSMPRMADPKIINFDIDGDDVIIHYAGKASRNELVLTGKEEKTMIYIYKVN